PALKAVKLDDPNILLPNEEVDHVALVSCQSFAERVVEEAEYPLFVLGSVGNKLRVERQVIVLRDSVQPVVVNKAPELQRGMIYHLLVPFPDDNGCRY